MMDTRSRSTLAYAGVVGFFAGGGLGFLFRPSSFMVGQAPFEAVITRGANLKGLDSLLIPLCQTSFNIMVAGALIGTGVALLVGQWMSKKRC